MQNRFRKVVPNVLKRNPVLVADRGDHAESGSVLVTETVDRQVGFAHVPLFRHFAFAVNFRVANEVAPRGKKEQEENNRHNWPGIDPPQMHKQNGPCW